MPSREGVPLLIQVARINPNPKVRKAGRIWLRQSKDTRALTFLGDVLQ
jgi:hypothetical protein